MALKKNAGPPLVSKALGGKEILPKKFHFAVVQTALQQKNPNDTVLPALATAIPGTPGDLVIGSRLVKDVTDELQLQVESLPSSVLPIVLTDKVRSKELRGRETLLVETLTLGAQSTDAGALASEVKALGGNWTLKTSELENGNLPFGELFLGGWQQVGIPARVGAITHKAFCNNSSEFKMTTELGYVAIGGTLTKQMRSATSVLCQTRRIVQYLATIPIDLADPWVVTYTSGVAKVGDIKKTSGSIAIGPGGGTPDRYSICTVAGNLGTWYDLGPGGLAINTQQLRYDGVFVNVSINNALNDTLNIRGLIYDSGTGAFTEITPVAGKGLAFHTGSCDFFENYNFPATSPTASDYAASGNPDGFGGRWWIQGASVEAWGTTGYRRTTEEFLAPSVGW